MSSYFFDFPIVRSKIEIDVDQSVTDRDRQEDVLGGETQAEAIWQTEVTDRSRGLKEKRHQNMNTQDLNQECKIQDRFAR